MIEKNERAEEGSQEIMGNGYGRESPEKKLVGREWGWCWMEGIHGCLRVWREVEWEGRVGGGEFINAKGSWRDRWERQVRDRLGMGHNELHMEKMWASHWLHYSHAKSYIRTYIQVLRLLRICFMLLCFSLHRRITIIERNVVPLVAFDYIWGNIWILVFITIILDPTWDAFSRNGRCVSSFCSIELASSILFEWWMVVEGRGSVWYIVVQFCFLVIAIWQT